MLVKCIRPIFDGRNPKGPRFIERGQMVELEDGEVWPGVKDMRRHFDIPPEKKIIGKSKEEL